MPQRSAGVLLYDRKPDGLAVLLVHPGGPWWRGKDAGAWQIPKGAIEAGEDPEAAALREAEEELGVRLAGQLRPLGELRQSGGKLVTAFALEQEFDARAVASNRFEMEWPPGSGRVLSFPEVDAARWFSLAEAAEYMLPSQRPLLDRLAALLGHDSGEMCRR